MTTAQMDWSAVFDRAATATAFRDTTRSAASARADAADTRQRFSLDDVLGGSARPARPAASEAPRTRPEKSAPGPQAAERPRDDKRAPAAPDSPNEAAAPLRPDPRSRAEAASRPAPASKQGASAKAPPATSDAAAAEEAPRLPEGNAATDAPAREEGAVAATAEATEGEGSAKDFAAGEASPVDPTGPNAVPVEAPPSGPAPAQPPAITGAALNPPEPATIDSEAGTTDEADAPISAGAATKPQAQPWQAAAALPNHRPSVVLQGAAGAASVPEPQAAATGKDPAVEGAPSTSSTPSTDGAPSTPKAVEFAQMLETVAGGAPAASPLAAGGAVPPPAALDAAGVPAPAAAAPTGGAAATAPTASAPAPAAPGHAEAAAAPVPLGAVPMTIALRALQETHRFEIRLDPADLGRIDVRLDIDRQDGTVRTDLVVDRPATLSLLQRDAGALQQALSQAGLDASGGINLSLRDGSADGRATGQGQGQGSGGEAGRGRPDAPHGSAQTDSAGAAASVAARTLRLAGIDIRI